MKWKISLKFGELIKNNPASYSKLIERFSPKDSYKILSLINNYKTSDGKDFGDYSYKRSSVDNTAVCNYYQIDGLEDVQFKKSLVYVFYRVINVPVSYNICSGVVFDLDYKTEVNVFRGSIPY